MAQRCYLLVDYIGWRGGVNNVQVARLCPLGARGMFLKRFTSTVDRAGEYARRWAKENNISIIGS